MDAGLLMMFYALYYGVLARDVAEICTEKMVAGIGVCWLLHFLFFQISKSDTEFEFFMQFCFFWGFVDSGMNIIFVKSASVSFDDNRHNMNDYFYFFSLSCSITSPRAYSTENVKVTFLFVFDLKQFLAKKWKSDDFCAKDPFELIKTNNNL